MASGGGEGLPVPLIMDTFTFDMRQEQRLKEMEKKMHDEVKKKRKEWDKEVDKMRLELLTLHPGDKLWGSDELVSDPLVHKRRGSTDMLDPRKMRTMYLEYPDGISRFKIRFDVRAFQRKTVKVTTDIERIIVSAVKIEEDEDGKMVERNYVRKIAMPKKVDPTKLKSFLTQDGILTIDAPLPPHTLNLRKLSHSPSHSSYGSHHSSLASSRSRSPSCSPLTPSKVPKYGLPVFVGDKDGEKILSLIIDLGPYFRPKDVTVQVIKDNRIQVKAKNELRTSDRLSKNKFFKEYELGEKIETLSLRGGLDDGGKLMIAALQKGHPLFNKKNFHETTSNVDKHINDTLKTVPINVLDLASFPPIQTALAGSVENNADHHHHH